MDSYLNSFFPKRETIGCICISTERNYFEDDRLFPLELSELDGILHLRRSGLIPYYVLGQQEVDFYGSSFPLINACYALDSPTTRRREEEGLLEAMHAHNQSESWLITWEEEATLRRDGKFIHVRPLWKWLLEAENTL